MHTEDSHIEFTVALSIFLLLIFFLSSATVSGSGLPVYTLSSLCDISRSPLQLAQAEQVDTQVMNIGCTLHIYTRAVSDVWAVCS